MIVGKALFPRVACVLDLRPVGGLLSATAVNAVRRQRRIQRLVVIVDDPMSESTRTIVGLARASSTNFKGDPYLPVAVVAIEATTWVMLLLRVPATRHHVPYPYLANHGHFHDQTFAAGWNSQQRVDNQTTFQYNRHTYPVDPINPAWCSHHGPVRFSRGHNPTIQCDELTLDYWTARAKLYASRRMT